MDKETALYIIIGAICIMIGLIKDINFSFIWITIGILNIVIAIIKNNSHPPFSF